MAQQTFTKRPRSGWQNTMAVNSTVTVAIPNGTRFVSISATGAQVGININGTGTAPTAQAAGAVGPFAYLSAGVPTELVISPSVDTHLHIRSGGTAPTVSVGFYF